MSDRQPDAAQAEAKRREDEARTRAEASQQVARQYEATTKARAELNAEAERVMVRSPPAPPPAPALRADYLRRGMTEMDRRSVTGSREAPRR